MKLEVTIEGPVGPIAAINLLGDALDNAAEVEDYNITVIDEP